MTSPSQKLHILHLPSWYLPEGGQFCRNQVGELHKHGVNARVLANVNISLKKYGFASGFKFRRGVFLSYEDDIQVFRHFHFSFPFFKKIDSRLWVKKTLEIFEKYVKKFGRPDVIHVHSVLWGGYAAKLIKDKYKIPYIITEHRGIFGMSCEWAENQFIEWQDPYMSDAYSHADLIIPVSENLIPKINSFLSSEVPFSVVSNMIDSEYFYYRERKKSDVEIRAVMVNGFNHAKAYDVLFPAADAALGMNADLTITIVGEDFFGEEFEKLWSRVKHKDRIRFLGEIDQSGVRDALWDADFFIISSRVESQSVSVLEALSTGLPVVCTSVIPEQIANESNAVRVPVENVSALTDGILEMAEKFMTFDGREISDQIKTIADNKVVAQQLIKLYQSII